ncbi:uncharacterized protein [Physcomitrium patens]|uniref:Uncharacterized protein n=1 Tax=Physcomitrium patens TaxID=3218 RepID=A0A2K1K3S7_PHYPA|nr:transcription factor KUA1-like [Physcomitrium patens]PNR48431.1 hypothetical protein PHYPA_012907 [Physcomitrium patens]|eukprot:XP_024385378.1 transcription factor KUA1-like [Physcomitrella patens]
MSRRCSHCGLNGHNSRTCPERGVRLFGVRLTDSVSSTNMRKSVSMNNLSHYSNVHNPASPPEQWESGAAPDGYVSDGLVQTSNNARERKKGVPWTEDEHRLFLLGLQKLGKGDWRGISRNYVHTRTPTQVASHAQKYFIRQSNLNKRKRRSSLFDIVSESGVPSIAEESTSIADEEHATPLPQLSLGHSSLYTAAGVLYKASSMQGYRLPVRPHSVPKHASLPMALPLMAVGSSRGGRGAAGAEGMTTEVVGMMGFDAKSSSRSGLERPVARGMSSSYNMESSSSRSAMDRGGPAVPVAVASCAGDPGVRVGGASGAGSIPFSFSWWAGLGQGRPMGPSPPQCNIVRPTAKVAAVSSAPAKMEEEEEKEDGRDIAELSLGPSRAEPSQLTAKLLEAPSRHSSAFHVSSSFDANSIQQGVNAISVV